MTQISEDGFWIFVDGKWVPSQMQIEALSKGAIPHNQSHELENKLVNNSTEDFSSETLDFKHKQQVSPARRSKKYLILGTVFIAISLVLVIVISSLSPGTISLLDEIRDSDGDGITDYEELRLGTNPELRDSDNDGMDDPEDDCPSGEINWESNIITDWDGDGCQDSGEDSDDDNDGIPDDTDRCDTSSNWISTPSTDNDADGCHDDGDADDDNDGWSDANEQQCGTNSLSKYDVPDDLDDDMVCDLIDLDDDGDNVDDINDIFPRDGTEWADFDEDGIGDNTDLDDDNDGVSDILDKNDYADVGLTLTLDTFELFANMDYFDSLTELYACVYVESDVIGCGPGDGTQYWQIQTYTLYSLDTQFYFDIDDTISSSLIQICAWDSDYSDDDRIDINPSSSNNCFGFYVDTSRNTGYSETLTATGVGDNTGYDAEMELSYSVIDMRQQRFNNFEWEYESQSFNIAIQLEYSTYVYYKNLEHYAGGIGDADSYAVYVTPDQQYVIDLATELKQMAITSGFASEIEIAEFIYSFVGNIQYLLDTESSNSSDYPMYPIEMLWQAAGDCEDASILYLSLIESLDYEGMLATGLVKNDADDDWGGHAWALIHIPNHAGPYDGWYGIGENSDLPFYFVEATGYYYNSEIGRNPWYDTDLYDLADIP